MEFLGIATYATLVLCLCVFLLQSRFSITKAVRWKIIASYAGCWVLIIVTRLLTNDALIIALAAMLTAGFLSRYLGQATALKTFSVGALFGVLQVIACVAGIALQSAIPDLEVTPVLFPEAVVLYSLTVCACTFSEKWRIAPKVLLALIPVWLVFVLLCEEILRRRSGIGLPIIIFFADLWMLYASVHLVQVRKKMEAKISELLEAQQKSHHYALQEEYYRQLRDKQDETRALWHDLNKYLKAAKAETPDAPSLAQLENMIHCATQIVDVGNNVLNVILNEYDQSARVSGVDLRMRVQVSPVLPITPADLYILIGNTMDNALEACRELPAGQRIIDLTLRTHNNVLYYKLTNPYMNHINHNIPDSVRGYGLPNVHRCVQKYDGNVDIWKENGFFTVSAHLNLE